MGDIPVLFAEEDVGTFLTDETALELLLSALYNRLMQIKKQMWAANVICDAWTKHRKCKGKPDHHDTVTTLFENPRVLCSGVFCITSSNDNFKLIKHPQHLESFTVNADRQREHNHFSITVENDNRDLLLHKPIHITGYESFLKRIERKNPPQNRISVSEKEPTSSSVSTLTESCEPECMSSNEMERRRCAAIKIQAAWRGYCVRCKSTPEMTDLSKKIKFQRSVAQPENTIGQRTSYALQKILEARPLSFSYRVINHLIIATSSSANSCRQIVLKGAIPVLYTYIEESNRSVASTFVVQRVIQVLINLAKFHETLPAVVSYPRWFEVLANTILHFQNYEQQLISKVVVLLLILSALPCAQAKMSESPVFVQKLKLAAQRLKKLEQCKKFRSSSCGTIECKRRIRHQHDQPTEHYTPDWVLGVVKPNENFTPSQGLFKLFVHYNIDYDL
ncbi:unnamed protein product [Soboliphyme baturini]|uniref:TAF6_C domain-containing protein n=1 Tax=Soboliphyme baturini TaxID=241478 RepID=A0A183IVI8_9BILA|nr:unnamed protein product [Soboliphyme baturini]